MTHTHTSQTYTGENRRYEIKKRKKKKEKEREVTLQVSTTLSNFGANAISFLVLLVGSVWFNGFNAELCEKRCWRGPISQEVGGEEDHSQRFTVTSIMMLR